MEDGQGFPAAEAPWRRPTEAMGVARSSPMNRRIWTLVGAGALAIAAVATVWTVASTDVACPEGAVAGKGVRTDERRYLICQTADGRTFEAVFDDDGRLRETAFLAGELRHGEFTGYSQTGAVQAMGKYADGRREGAWVELFDSGAKRSEFHFRGGVKHGLATTWYESETVKSRGDYINGERSDTGWQEWTPDGRPVTAGSQTLGAVVSTPEDRTKLIGGRPVDWWEHEVGRADAKTRALLTRRAQAAGLTCRVPNGAAGPTNASCSFAPEAVR